MRYQSAAAAIGMVAMCTACGDQLSPDCQRTEDALRPMATGMVYYQSTFPADLTDEPLDRAGAAAAEAQVAADIRAGVEGIESDALRAEVFEVADAFDTISRSTLAPASAIPSRDYFASKRRIDEALQTIMKLCPGIGDDPVPPVTR
ncbi:hypothetical protein [Mycolicibacterium phlei]